MLEPASGHEKVALKPARSFNSAIPVQYSGLTDRAVLLPGLRLPDGYTIEYKMKNAKCDGAHRPFAIPLVNVTKT